MMFILSKLIVFIFLIVCLLCTGFSFEHFKTSGCSKKSGCNNFKSSIIGSLGPPSEYHYHCHQNLKDGAAIITSNNKHIKNLGPQTAKRLGGTCANISKRHAEQERKRSELNATKQNLRSLKQLSDGQISSTSKYKAATGNTTIQGQIRKLKSQIATLKEQQQQK